ncbi:MAG: hypothetical protein H0U97_07715 [Gammaproteobacteria bacterium]|nr:hypothetical protein [Gammaproteobacteria bacterium]
MADAFRDGTLMRVALVLYRAALAHGGWVAELRMLWARGAFVRAFDAARGVLWELETAA